jgi:hypothetical protein
MMMLDSASGNAARPACGQTEIMMKSLESRRLLRRGLVAGLAFAATLLLADAGSAKSNHGSSSGGAAATPPAARRCDPPPCPAKATVKSQQPPSVWSGSMKPTEGNTTSKPGPIH